MALNTQQMQLLSITKKLSFPAKLFFILEFIDLYAPHLKPIFCWKHHGRCFNISSDRKSFEQNIMALFFSSAKYDTFRRQLNIWGFTRITKVRSPDVGCYFHEKFLRGRFDLCNTMTRSRVSEFMKMPGNQPDFEDMPIMSATVTVSLPHFAGVAKNLSSALCEQKVNVTSNSIIQVSSDKKRKQWIDDVSQAHDNNAGLYSSVDDSSVCSYPASLPEQGPSAISSIRTDLPLLLIANSSNDTSSNSNDTQHTFSDQSSSRKKAKRGSIGENSFLVQHPTEDNDAFNEIATLASNWNPMNLGIDVMHIEQSFALVQMFHNQQQVDNFNPMKMIPCATPCPSTMTYHHDRTNQDTETLWKENHSTRKDTSMLNTPSFSAPTFKKKLSDILLSKELVSCNSLLSISAPADFKEMKDFLLGESNHAWFEDSLSF